VAELADYERRFRRAGLPLFIEDYSAREDVWTRAAPLLALVLIGELLGATQFDWSLQANLAAGAGGLAILAGAFGPLNLLRRRAFFSLPEHVGPAELAGFVLVPAALPLIFGGQWGSALVTAGANLLLLALTYAVIRYGVLSILRWTGPRLIDQLDASVSVLSRAVPLLLVFALVLFINTEMWQVFSTMPRAFLACVGALFVVVGTVFVGVQLPREVRRAGGGRAGGGRQQRRPTARKAPAIQRRPGHVRQPGAADLAGELRGGGLLRRVGRTERRPRGARRLGGGERGRGVQTEPLR
jgi:hypothetical protein